MSGTPRAEDGKGERKIRQLASAIRAFVSPETRFPMESFDMKKSYLRSFFLSGALLTLVPLACGGGGGAGSEAPCRASTDCVTGETCLGLGTEGACRLNCSVSGNECSGEASCEGIGGVSANFCKKKEEPSSSSGGSDASSSEEEPEEDWIRCTADTDCEAYEPSAVCASWSGVLICTIACSDSAMCNPPAIQGVTTTFIECTADEGNTARNVCLPRQECFSDPLSCIAGIPTDPEGTGGGDSDPDGSGGNPGTGGDNPFGTGGAPFGPGDDFDF